MGRAHARPKDIPENARDDRQHHITEAHGNPPAVKKREENGQSNESSHDAHTSSHSCSLKLHVGSSIPSLAFRTTASLDVRLSDMCPIELGKAHHLVAFRRTGAWIVRVAVVWGGRTI